MDKLFAIIRREYLARVRSKWFIATTLLAPVLLAGAMMLPVLLAVRQAGRVTEVTVLDESGQILPELLETDAFAEGQIRFRPPPRREPVDEVLAVLRQQVIDRELAGYLHIPADVLNGGEIQFWGRDVGQTLIRSTIAPATNTAIQRVRARSLGLDPATANRLTASVRVELYRVTDEGVAREEEHIVLAAHVLSLAIYSVVLLYGAMMLRAAVAEKSSKTVEIILSSVRPWQLMLGKILGVGAVGLTQLGVWLSMIAVFLLYAATAQAFADVDFFRNLPVGLDTLALFVGLFLSGYFLYGGLYASVGAIASTEQEASQLQFPVTLLVILPILIIPVVLETPASTPSRLLSWVPFFTPVLFIARHVLGGIALWEIPLVFSLQIVAILCVAWIGGRIYRVGLLMTGKRPTIPEVFRWVRHG